MVYGVMAAITAITAITLRDMHMQLVVPYSILPTFFRRLHICLLFDVFTSILLAKVCTTRVDSVTRDTFFTDHVLAV